MEMPIITGNLCAAMRESSAVKRERSMPSAPTMKGAMEPGT
jgi:hypothetical protein